MEVKHNVDLNFKTVQLVKQLHDALFTTNTAEASSESLKNHFARLVNPFGSKSNNRSALVQPAETTGLVTKYQTLQNIVQARRIT